MSGTFGIDPSVLSPESRFLAEKHGLLPPSVKRRPRPNHPNPFYCPRPQAIEIGDVDDEWEFRWLFERQHLLNCLEGNEEWLTWEDRTTRQVYDALFSLVDPRGIYRSDGMGYLNEALWAFGFRTIEGGSKGINHVWYMPDDSLPN